MGTELQWQNVAPPSFSGAVDDTRQAAILLSNAFSGFGKSLQDYGDRGVASNMAKYTTKEALEQAIADGTLDTSSASSEMLANVYARQQSLLQDAVQREAYNQSHLMNPLLVSKQQLENINQGYTNRQQAIIAEVNEATKQAMIDKARLNNENTQATTANTLASARQTNANSYITEQTSRGLIDSRNTTANVTVANNNDLLKVRDLSNQYAAVTQSGQIRTAEEAFEWVKNSDNPRLALLALQEQDPTMAKQVAVSGSVADLSGNIFGDAGYGTVGSGDPLHKGSNEISILGGAIPKDVLNLGYANIPYQTVNGTLGEYVADAPRVIQLNKKYMRDPEAIKNGWGSSASGPFQIMLTQHAPAFKAVFGENWRDVNWQDYKNHEKVANYIAESATEGKSDSAAGAALRFQWKGLANDRRSDAELGQLFRANKTDFWQTVLKYESPRALRKLTPQEQLSRDAQESGRREMTAAAQIPVTSDKHPSTLALQRLKESTSLASTQGPTSSLDYIVSTAYDLRKTVTNPSQAVGYIQKTLSPLGEPSAGANAKQTISEDAKKVFEYTKKNLPPSLQDDYALISAIAVQISPKIGLWNDIKSTISNGRLGYSTDPDAFKAVVGKVNSKQLELAKMQMETRMEHQKKIASQTEALTTAQQAVRQQEEVYRRTGSLADQRRLAQAQNRYYTLGQQANSLLKP